MIRQPNTTCRWRIWRAYGPGASKFATREVAEHFCDGEFLWIARDAVDGATWMIDDCAVSLMEVVDHIPLAMAEWLIDQTVLGVGGLIAQLVGLEARDDLEPASQPIEANDQLEQFARMRGLMTEFMRFAHAGALVADKLEILRERFEQERVGETGARPAAA